MSKNEPDSDFTTRTWFVGEEGEEEQAPEDTLIPGEQPTAATSGNDSLIAGEGLSSGPAVSNDEQLTAGQLEHTDTAIAGAAESVEEEPSREDETRAIIGSDGVEEPDANDGTPVSDTAEVPERKSLIARNREVEEGDPLPDPVPVSEVESTADRRYSLLNSSEDVPEPASEDTPHWDSVEETEPEEVLTTAERQKSFEETIFEGATVKPTVPSRAAAHVWSLLLYLVLVPLTWYLVLDVATRLSTRGGEGILPASSLNVGQWAEVVAAIISVFLLVLVARLSSLGAFITGLAVTIGGAFFLMVPERTANGLNPLLTALDNAGQQGHFYQALPANIAHHLAWSGGSGMLLLAGLSLLGIGFLAHSARRAGRKDYLIERKVKAAEATSAKKD